MEKELKCPKCGSTNIERCFCLNECCPDDIGITEAWNGFCNDCNSNFHWLEMYNFAGYISIELDKED